jgi:hypothetical protein
MQQRNIIMAKWLIDIGNNKRGFYFSKVQDITSNAFLTESKGEYVANFDESGMYAFHSQTDPRSVIIFEETLEDESAVTSIGLKKVNESTSQPLRLDAIKTFLDSAQSATSPLVALQYQFESASANVTTREAIENARYVTKITNIDGSHRMVDIVSEETVWTSPEQKHVVNYLFAGKIASVPDTYFILLNGFRTELYQELNESNGNTFEYLSQSTGSFKNFFIKPAVVNGKLFDDIIFAEGQNIVVKPFGEFNQFLAKHSLSANDVSYEFETNSVSCTKDSNGNLNIDLGTKTIAYLSISIPSNNLLDLGPDLAIRRTFTIHRA